MKPLAKWQIVAESAAMPWALIMTVHCADMERHRDGDREKKDKRQKGTTEHHP